MDILSHYPGYEKEMSQGEVLLHIAIALNHDHFSLEVVSAYPEAAQVKVFDETTALAMATERLPYGQSCSNVK